jgi:hypothetical protein
MSTSFFREEVFLIKRGEKDEAMLLKQKLTG